MSDIPTVDAEALREEIKDKYRAVAVEPDGTYQFHTGRRAAKRLGYHDTVVDPLPNAAMESFSGVGNPFELGTLEKGEKVVDIGSGAGFDCFVAATQVGPSGQVIGIDMTEENYF